MLSTEHLLSDHAAVAVFYPLMSNHSLVAAAASPEDPYEQSPYLKRTLGPFWGLA